MPSGTWVRYEFTRPSVIVSGPEMVTVLLGTYAGLPVADEEGVFELFRIGSDGEPVGECQGRMGGMIVNLDEGTGGRLAVDPRGS